jgi:hypothetical protein
MEGSSEKAKKILKDKIEGNNFPPLFNVRLSETF